MSGIAPTAESSDKSGTGPVPGYSGAEPVPGNSDTAPVPGNARPGRSKLGRPRLLIVGCGDVGLRIVARVRERFRIIATTTSADRLAAIRAAGAVPIRADLDDRRALARLHGFGSRAIFLAPPPNHGARDLRIRRFAASMPRGPYRHGGHGGHSGHCRRRPPLPAWVYISTTGVYGDRAGAWIDESVPARPASERAVRRLDAERTARAARACVLRVPGIYAQDRLPFARLRAGTPALAAADDVHSNHIHADDLARIAIVALARGRVTRVYNAVDDSDLKMADYFDLVADAFKLPRPPRLPRAELRAVLSPIAYSFMSESRRLRNARMKRELRVALRFPTVASALLRGLGS